MKEALEKVWMPLKSYLDEMDKKKRTGFIVIASALALIVMVSAIVLSKQEYVVLYKGLATEEAGEILAKLEEMKVDAKPKGTDTILVPSKEADKIRMQLSAQGYPKSSFNYDIFQNSLNFGATDFEKQKYLQFQLQERLQNSIKTLDIVEDAIVTLNMPDNSSFVLKEDKQKASASVILKLKGRESLSKEQVKGIEGLVTKSVPGLQTSEVFIIDSLGNSLKSNASTGMEIAGEQLEMEAVMSKRMQNEIVSLLEPVFGLGKVSAGVRVSLDFDERTSESLRFDPIADSSGIAVSESVASEELSNANRAGNVGQNANGGAPQYAETNGNNGQYKKENKTVNYEVNQMREKVKSAEGQIKDISASVLLDENNYLPQDAELKVKDIVSGALGISADKIVVQKMAFQAQNEISKAIENAQKNSEAMKQRQQLMQNLILYGALAVLLLSAMIIAIRVMMRKRRKEIAEMAVFTTPAIQNADEQEQAALEIKRSDKKALIERSVKKNPELVALLLRNWLREDVR